MAYYDPEKARLLRGAGIMRDPDQVRRFRDYGQGAAGAAPVPAWSEYSVETPGRSPSPVADVVVPVLQAVVSGLLAGGGAAIGAAKLTEVDPALAGGMSALVVAAIVWLKLLVDSRRLLRKVETWTRQDLDGDGLVGDPEHETVRTRIETHHQTPGGTHWINDDLSVSRDELRRIFAATKGDAHQWSRRSIGRLPGIGDDRARDLILELERLGFVTYEGNRNRPDGAQLTAKGEALQRGLLQ